MWSKKFNQKKNYYYNFYKENSHESFNKICNSELREIKVVKKVLNENDKIASKLRNEFYENKVFVINIMSSPGSGKTTTLQKTLDIIKHYVKCAVIVGDICTTNDADRLSKSGSTVIQINTDKFGGDCHLTASSINQVIKNINLKETQLLIIENIGNLVCPAEFDLGEDCKIVMLSITEGEDKPAKYPLMFRESNAAILNKIDLLPYLDFDIELAKKTIHLINPDIPVFEISAKTEEGFDLWIKWLRKKVNSKIENP